MGEGETGGMEIQGVRGGRGRIRSEGESSVREGESGGEGGRIRE